MPSGTMGNQIGLRLVCQPGEEILGDADCHVLTYELGAAAAIFGLSSRTVVSDGGRLDADRLIEQVRPRGDWHVTPTAAIAVENTHNRGGGLVQPLDELQKLWDWSREAGVAVHLDGARILNAAVATGKDLATFGRLADTASVCLSKGLGTPVGSVLVASADRIAAARLWRKRLGGGMRQAGILAAAGLYALDHHLERLADDHEHARLLAERLGRRPGVGRDEHRRRGRRERADGRRGRQGAGRAGRPGRARAGCGWSPTSTSTAPASTAPPPSSGSSSPADVGRALMRGSRRQAAHQRPMSGVVHRSPAARPW